MSVWERARRRGRFLELILEDKRRELARRRRVLDEGVLRLQVRLWPAPLPLRTFLPDPQGRLRPVIALMRAAPFRGLLRPSYDPVSLACSLATHEIAALAVMTDARYYQGRLEHLAAVKQALLHRRLTIPVIRHDFFLDPFQVLEARAFGADAIWISIGMLSPSALQAILEAAAEYGLDVLAEVRTETEVEAALRADVKALIVQRRDWRTFEVDPALPARLRPVLPETSIRIVAGGISTVEEVEEARTLGFHAVVLEEALLSARDPLARLDELGFA
ncbi:MAG TPA: indole-3-glycerol-phosphate synthase [Thermoflexus sp.]|nr:indole-3-glycerol-phosphate synthase [Thermoflexus sp.]